MLEIGFFFAVGRLRPFLRAMAGGLVGVVIDIPGIFCGPTATSFLGCVLNEFRWASFYGCWLYCRRVTLGAHTCACPTAVLVLTQPPDAALAAHRAGNAFVFSAALKTPSNRWWTPVLLYALCARWKRALCATASPPVMLFRTPVQLHAPSGFGAVRQESTSFELTRAAR